jgi:signal transduction histidine kinase
MTTDTLVLPDTTPAAAPATPPPRARGWFRQLGLDTGYVLVSFPLAIAAFVVIVTGLALGIGLLVVWVGVAVLAVTLLAARALATAERAWLPAVLRRPLPRPAYLPAEGRPVRKLLTPLRDPQTWLDALHAVLRFPLAIFSFVVTVTFWAVALGGLTYGAWDWALPDASTDRNNQDLLELVGLESTAGRRILLYTAIGLVFAVLLPLVVRGVALLQAQLGRALLTSRGATQAELGRLTQGRNAAVAAEAVALRRLERDIHDGPQQQLVRLNMDLARAQRQLERDPSAARASLSEAAGLARETLEDLRALSRGIAPPVLADRGLAAALAAIAARSPVPVDLAVDLPAERLAPITENTAYFVVSEALANVAKHSDATTTRVDVRCTGDRLRVLVEDDGTGGAVLAPGHGLSGLTDRLLAVDGVLTVDSPRGGPTRLTAELPCG